MLPFIRIAILVLVITRAASAMALTFEVTPFVGYRIGGSINVYDSIYNEVSVEEAPAYGLTVGYEVSEEGHVEIMWSRQHDTDVIGKGGWIGGNQALFKTRIDQYHLNGLYLWGDQDEWARPFILLGLGVTHFNPVDDISGGFRFSFGLGGGVKMYLGKHLGIRLQGRWAPTYVPSSSAIYCSLPGFCYVRTTGQLINQGEVTAGLILRF